LLNYLNRDSFERHGNQRRGFLCRGAFGLSFSNRSLCRFSGGLLGLGALLGPLFSFGLLMIASCV
jgi:hypothetical protein